MAIKCGDIEQQTICLVGKLGGNDMDAAASLSRDAYS